MHVAASARTISRLMQRARGAAGREKPALGERAQNAPVRMHPKTAAGTLRFEEKRSELAHSHLGRAWLCG